MPTAPRIRGCYDGIRKDGNRPSTSRRGSRTLPVEQPKRQRRGCARSRTVKHVVRDDFSDPRSSDDPGGYGPSCIGAQGRALGCRVRGSRSDAPSGHGSAQPNVERSARNAACCLACAAARDTTCISNRVVSWRKGWAEGLQTGARVHRDLHAGGRSCPLRNTAIIHSYLDAGFVRA